MKKLILSWLLIFWLFVSISSAAKLSIVPANWSIGRNCVVGFDIMLDSNNESIVGTDLLIDSSMKFVDFVPTNLFKNVLPPIVQDNGVIRLWLFSFPENLVNQGGSIWKIYFKDTTSNYDSYIKFIFKGKWNTVDTNLFVSWAIDILSSVSQWSYILDWETCAHDVAITGWFAGKTYDEALWELKNNLKKDWLNRRMKIFFSSKLFIGGSIWLVLIIVLLFILKFKWSKKIK